MKISPFLLLQLALLGSLAIPASATDLYWKRTTTAAWTTSNWGTDSGGPYTSAWVSGSNVIFEDNGATALAITGATTNVGSITANENVTVTAGGTLTLAGPINVADGKTLNFGTQVLSGAGIEKTGLGTLSLNANNSFTGGFAIRGGTVYVRNANALGSGSVTLGATSGSDFATLRVVSLTFSRPIILETGTTGALAIASLGGNATSVYTGGVTGTNNLNIRSVVGGAGTATTRFQTGSINHVGSLTLANTGNGTSTSAVGVIDIRSAIGSNVTDLTISNLTTGTTGLQRVFIRSSSNAYTGNTTIDDGAILILQNGNVIPDGAGKGNVEVNGTLDMRGGTETINGLSGTGTIGIYGAITSTTLTVGGNDTTASFGGTIENGVSNTTVSLTKIGAGTQTLTGTNTYTGATTVSAGTLALTGATQATSAITFTGGSLGFDTEFPVTAASAAVNLTNGTITVTGATGSPIYTLLTAASITGTPVLAEAVPGYELQLIDGDTSDELRLVQSGGGPGPLDKFAISEISSPQTVGVPITGITITAQDSANQTVTSFSGTVTFSGTGGFSGISGDFIDGVLTGASVTPTVAGSNLTFVVTGGDPGKTGTATITTIQTKFQAWAAGYELTGDDALPTANPDGDSLTNLQEFAFGFNPTVSDGAGPLTISGSSITQNGPPHIYVEPGSGKFFLRYTRRTDYAAAGLTYLQEFAANTLGSGAFQDVAGGSVVATGTGAGGVAIEAVAIEFPDSLPGSDKKARFGRVGVTQQAP
jgi:autotransporter-associated beta strand protein